jgi:cation:H+ antiporter
MNIYLALFMLIAGFALLIKGADWFVEGASSVAKLLKVPAIIIGLTVVAFGTSLPEASVSISSAIAGMNSLAVSNVVGSNIFNVLGILGITAIFFPIAVDRKNMRFELPLCIFVSVLLLLLTFNCFNGSASSLARLDGILLLLVFALYMLYSFARDRKEAAVAADNGDGGSLWKAVLKVVGGLALLITSCDFFVDNAVSVAKSFGVDNAFISLTLIACGTSLPELAASVAAAVKKNTDMALGNIVGSNIFNITLILGLSSQVMPLTSSGITYIDYIVMIAAAVLLFVIGLFGRIGRLSGLLMFICFVLYNWYLVSNQMA